MCLFKILKLGAFMESFGEAEQGMMNNGIKQKNEYLSLENQEKRITQPCQWNNE